MRLISFIEPQIVTSVFNKNQVGHSYFSAGSSGNVIMPPSYQTALCGSDGWGKSEEV
jgi:hypothetical protein